MLLLLPLLFQALAAPGPLWIELGAENRGAGLSVPSAGDGENAPATVDGQACRRVAGGKSGYLYVLADDARVPPGSYDAYVVVEHFDAAPGLAQVQYDRVAANPDIGTRYTTAEDVILLLGTGKWQRAALHLPEARFGSGQNHGADLRLVASDLAVRRIEILFAPPEGYRPGGIDPAQLEQLRTRIGAGVELTFGADPGPGQAALFRALGVTSVETYVTWQTVEDTAEGTWDWSRWDRQVEILQRAGLKWVPFLIAGPAYATPKWYRESGKSVPFACLDHGTESKVQSIWSPHLRPHVERFLKAFAERYRDRGVIESVLLGVTGIYGESIYPAGPEGGWTADIPGAYHNHGGWWAGDPHAVADFRRAVQRRYRDVAALNRAWGTRYAGFDEVSTFLPDKAPSPRARVDFVEWYHQAMTEWSAFWVAATRKHFSKTEIYLCTGGDGNPVLGADFSAQAKAIAPYGAGIRITNEGSDYTANFAVTREVATATRAFGTFCGFEPASGVDANGVVARLYNATASGARQLHYYANNVTGGGEAIGNFRRYASFLQRREPRVAAGFYLPKTSWAMDAGLVRTGYGPARDLRDCVDLEFVDRTTLGQRGLRGMRVLALAEAPYAEAAETEAIRRWVSGGGILVALAPDGKPLLRTPEGSDAGRDALLARPPANLDLARVALAGKPPRRFRLELGQGRDGDYLFGDWFHQERGLEWPDVPGATKRWSGPRPGIYLPVDPEADAVFTLDAHLSGHSLSGQNRVLVNGTPIGVFDQGRPTTYRFEVPRALLRGRSVAEVTMELTTWIPDEHGMHDARALGVALRSVEICARGAESEAPRAAPLTTEIDWELARRHCLRRIGKGATLALPADPRGSTLLSAAVVGALTHPERLVPGAKGVVLPAPERDGVYATQTADGVLFLNTNPEACRVGNTEVPAWGIAWAR